MSCSHPNPLIKETKWPAVIVLDPECREVYLRFVEFWCTMCDDYLLEPKMTMGLESWDQFDFDHRMAREIF